MTLVKDILLHSKMSPLMYLSSKLQLQLFLIVVITVLRINILIKSLTELYKIQQNEVRNGIRYYEKVDVLIKKSLTVQSEQDRKSFPLISNMDVSGPTISY